MDLVERTRKTAVAERISAEIERDSVASLILAGSDPVLRGRLGRALEHAGYRVYQAGSGTELLEQVERGRLHGKALDTDIDLIVVDARMSDGSGLQALREIRRDRWSAPAIVLAAGDDPYAHEEARRLGVSVVLDDPVEVDALCEAVEKIVPPSFWG